MAPTKPEKVAALRAAIIQEAREWVGTPYVDCGDVKGPKGAADCAMIVVAIYKKFGLVPPDFDPRPYHPDWHIHQNEEKYLNFLGLYAKRVDRAEPGDVVMYRFGKHASHGAILVADNLIVHAAKRVGHVEMLERDAMAHRESSYWTALTT